MKRTVTMLIVLLALSFILVLGASADTTGLAAFDTIADMSTYTFSDLVSNHWAFSGIKACYDRGIFIGYPDGTFYPEENITWSHAVTVAARIHSIYHGNALNDEVSVNDDWYAPYYDYCDERNLLPDSAPKRSDFDKKEITRYDLAYIFSKLLLPSDLTPISDVQISDLSSVPSKYLSAVKTMYAAGIMNGMDKNAFNGSQYATRAQIAEVVSRLLVPAYRVGSDARANLAMQPYEANLENDSVAVQIGSTYYCLYKTYTSPQTEQYALYMTSGNGVCRMIYCADAGDYLSNISVFSGKVYFCRSTSQTASGSLLCYDPSTEKITTVYAGSIVEAYCFYDKQLYALIMTHFTADMDGYTYDFGKITKGEFTPIHSNYTYQEVKYFQPYGWNGRLYFKLSSKNGPTYLYTCSIATGDITRVMDMDINTSFFDGHVMYFLAYDNEGNYDSNLYAISVQTPGVICSLGEFPAQTVNHSLRSLYKFEDTIYCLTAFNRNVYSMDKSGATRLALVCGGIYNSLCFTADKAILIPNTLTTSNANEIKIYNAKTLASRDLYGDWLGLSCYYEGRHFAPAEGTPKVDSKGASVSTVKNLSITIPEAFIYGNDFIILAKYTNNTGDDIKLRSYQIRIAVNGKLVATHNNRMSGYELKNHGIQSFTFVLSSFDMLSGFDITKDTISIEIRPTYEVVQK